MKIKKRAAASLIAWVLLIGLTVTLAGLVTTWAIKNARRFEPKKIAGPEIYCDNVAISFEDENTKIKNRGSLTIVSVYCVPSEEDPIEDFELKPGDPPIANPCSDEDEIIPGVESSEGDIVYCSMRGIKIEG